MGGLPKVPPGLPRRGKKNEISMYSYGLSLHLRDVFNGTIPQKI